MLLHARTGQTRVGLGRQLLLVQFGRPNRGSSERLLSTDVLNFIRWHWWRTDKIRHAVVHAKHWQTHVTVVHAHKLHWHIGVLLTMVHHLLNR